MMARRPRSASPEKNRGTDREGIARLKRRAPRTKSYWSSPDACAPRGRCIRLLTKAPARSPRSAPKARTAEAPRASGTVDPRDQLDEGEMTRNGAERRSPRTAPPEVPPTRPRQVLPSPNMCSPPRTSTRLPLVMPEVHVLVPVDPTHPQATADAHGNRLVLPLFRGRSQVPMNLPVGSANPSQGPRFRI